MTIKRGYKLVEVLPTIVQADSWARDMIGGKFVVQLYQQGNSYYQVISNGEPSNKLLPRRHVKEIKLVEPQCIEDFMSNDLIGGI